MTLIHPKTKHRTVIAHDGTAKEYSDNFLVLTRVFPSYNDALRSYKGWREVAELPLKFCRHDVAGFCIRCSGGKE